MPPLSPIVPKKFQLQQQQRTTIIAASCVAAVLTLVYMLSSSNQHEEIDGGRGAEDVARAKVAAAASPFPLEVLVEAERYLSDEFTSTGVYMEFSVKSMGRTVSQLMDDAFQKLLERRGHTTKVLTGVETEPADVVGVNVSLGRSRLIEHVDYSVFLPLLQRAAFRRLAEHHRHQPSSQYFAGIRKNGQIVLPRRLPINLEILQLVCEMIPLFSNETNECSPAAQNLARLLADLAAQTSRGGGNTADERILSKPETDRVRALVAKAEIVSDRARLSNAGFRQSSPAVYQNGAHPFVSVVGAAQSLCSGNSGLLDSNSKHRQLLRAFDTSLISVHGPELVDLVNNQLTPLDPSPRAEELLLTKLRVWDPLRSAKLGLRGVTPSEAMRLMMRPTVLCAILTYEGPEGLELALLQRSLWGHQCDDHIIFIASDKNRRSNGADGGTRSRQRSENGKKGDDNGKKSGSAGVSPIFEKRRQAANAVELESIIYLPIPAHVQRVKPDGSYYPNMWQLFREVVAWLEMTTRTDSYSYIYFGFEDNYVIPQNMQLMFLQRDLYTLNALSTPLFLGHRMVSSRNDGLAYASAGPGFILNGVALKILQSLMPLPGCFPNNASNGVDLLVASCLSLAGVQARDASDELGQDRMHVLSLHWLLQAPFFAAAAAGGGGTPRLHGGSSNSSTTADTPSGTVAGDDASSWWYLSHHQRTLQGQRTNPFLSLSTTSFSFNKVNTPSKALWLHLQLFPPPPMQQQ